MSTSVSIGNELKDGYKATDNWANNNIEFLSDVEQFFRQRSTIEKEYSIQLQKLTADFLKRKANKTIAISVGDEPLITPGSLESATLTTWNEVLSNVEIQAQNHDNFSKELSFKVSDQILSLQRSCDALLKRVEAYHDGDFTKNKDAFFESVTKAKKAYDESCQAMENARAKMEKNGNSSKYEQKYQEKKLEMNIMKNEYLIKINIANRIKDKFYYQDLPELLDIFQDLNEFKTQQLNKILTNASKIELSLNKKNDIKLQESINIVAQNQPVLDSQMFIKHNYQGSDWKEPQDFYYIPSSIWHDDETLITNDGELQELKKKLLKDRQQTIPLEDSLEARREDLNKLSGLKKQLKEQEVDQFELKKAIEVLNSYLGSLTKFISVENKKVENQVEIETIENNTVDKDLSLEGLTIQKSKSKGLFSKLRGGNNRKTEKLVSTDDYDDVESIKTNTTSHSHNFKIGSLLRSKSIATNHSVESTTSVLQGTALYAYTADGADEASIQPQEQFRVIKPDDGSGWTLISKSTGEEGLVPTSYITVQNVTVTATVGDSIKKKGPEVKPRKNNVKKLSYCMAKYGYNAEDEGELSISEGEKLVVLKGDDGGWTLGENSSGRKGLFPSSYVELV